MNTQDYYEQITGWTENRAFWAQYEAMYPIYLERVRAEWDWQEISNLADDNLEPDEFYGDDSTLVGRVYLGTVMALSPSGKFYTFWCSNFETYEAARDQAWRDAMECVASEYDLTIENGEGSATDLFAVSYVPSR